MGITNKIRVALLYGGQSGEHDVSLLSARSVMGAINTQKYEVLPILIHRDGSWEWAGDSAAIPQVTHEGVQAFPTLLNMDIDVVFPLLHGPNGEDGTIQGLLQLAGKAYVGAGVLASAAGMDKIMMKRLFAQAGIPQVAYIGYLRKDVHQRIDGIIAEIEDKIGYPCFVKPANLGSSVGISKARTKAELIDSLHHACRYDRKIIVEQFIDAREIEIAVLGNDDPIASVPGEIVTTHEFYDYDAKYTDGKSELLIPAELPKDTAVEMTELAKQAFAAIDGAGLARVDFFVERTTGAVYVNEINTMPGFTQYSMYPQLWQHSGISYTELIDRLITLGIARHTEQQS